MDASTLGARVEGHFGDAVKWADRSPKRLYVMVPPVRLHDVFTWLRDEVPGLRFMTSTVIDLREGVGVLHHLAINGRPLVVTLKVLAEKPDPCVPSLAAIVPAARWIEREMGEMVGVRFEGHPDARPLLKARQFPDDYPLKRDFDVAKFKEKIGELPDF